MKTTQTYAPQDEQANTSEPSVYFDPSRPHLLLLPFSVQKPTPLANSEVVLLQKALAHYREGLFETDGVEQEALTDLIDNLNGYVFEHLSQCATLSRATQSGETVTEPILDYKPSHCFDPSRPHLLILPLSVQRPKRGYYAEVEEVKMSLLKYRQELEPTHADLAATNLETLAKMIGRLDEFVNAQLDYTVTALRAMGLEANRITRA